MEVIALTKSIITGADLSEANIATFQEKRDKRYAAYQLHHEKGVGYGYANTFNAQAKVGFQLRVFDEKGEKFDPDHTVYNKDYLLEILDRGKASLDEMKAKGRCDRADASDTRGTGTRGTILYSFASAEYGGERALRVRRASRRVAMKT